MKCLLPFLLLATAGFGQLEVVEVLLEHKQPIAYKEFYGTEQVNFEMTRRSFPGTDSVAYYVRVYPIKLSPKNETALFDAPYRDSYLSPADLLKILSFIATATAPDKSEQKVTYWRTITDGLKLGITITPKGERFLHIQLFKANFRRELNKDKELKALGNFALAAYRKWNTLTKTPIR